MDDQEKDVPPSHDTPLNPEYQLAEDPAFLELVTSVEKAYESYIDALAKAIYNVECKQKHEKEIKELENPHYEDRLRADANEFEGTDLPSTLKRMSRINIATHIYGIKDWHAVLSALYDTHKNFKGDEMERAELAALLEKTKAVNNKIFRNLSRFSDAMRRSDTLSIEALNALPEEGPITLFTPREWRLLIAALQRIFDQQTQIAEQKIAAKNTRVAECRTQIETLDLQKPTLLEEITRTGEKLQPLVNSLSHQISEEHKRVKPVDHTTLVNPRSLYWESFRDWQNGILIRAAKKLNEWEYFYKGLYRSLENQLGWASGNNHFDIFFVDDQGQRISTTHVHAVLDIKLFLTLANEHFDVEIFRGELRGIETYRADGRTADFIIPKNGILQAGILKS